MPWDAVAIGSVITIVICVALLGCIAYWVVREINRKDPE